MSYTSPWYCVPCFFPLPLFSIWSNCFHYYYWSDINLIVPSPPKVRSYSLQGFLGFPTPSLSSFNYQFCSLFIIFSWIYISFRWLLHVSFLDNFHRNVLFADYGNSAGKRGLNCNLAVTLFINMDGEATKAAISFLCRRTEQASGGLQQHIHN